MAIEAVLQDRVERAVGLGADLEAAPAGGLEPGDAILASEPHDADAGTEAVLGMRAAAQNDLDQGGGAGSDGDGLALDALLVPVGWAASDAALAAMGRRHVVGQRGVSAACATEQVAGDALALVESTVRWVMRDSICWRSRRWSTE